MPKSGISSKLKRVILIQVAAISIATILGVTATAFVLENVLMRQALEGEATFFWTSFEKKPDFPAPHTLNLEGKLIPLNEKTSQSEFMSLPLGFQRYNLDGKNPIVHVSEQHNHRLVLIFDEQQVANLSLLFGVAPLAIVLMIIYLLSWLTYRNSRQAISPIVALSKHLTTHDIRSNALDELDLSMFDDQTDMDTKVLVDALSAYTARLRSAVERERSFTRDASHELRTPLAVIKGSANIIEKRAINDKYINDSNARILRTVAEMEALIETLMLLAKDDMSQVHCSEFSLKGLISDHLADYLDIAESKGIKIRANIDRDITLNANKSIMLVLLNNLVNNAIAYTEKGSVTIKLMSDSLVVEDTGVGIDPGNLEKIFQTFFRAVDHSQGHGLGLAIVKRICEQYRWQVTVVSEPGVGSIFTVRFAQ